MNNGPDFVFFFFIFIIIITYWDYMCLYILAMDFPLFHKLSYAASKRGYNIRKESNRKNSWIFDHKNTVYKQNCIFTDTSTVVSGLMSQNVLAGMSERRKRFFSTKVRDLKINFNMIQIYAVHASQPWKDNHTE